MAAPRNNLPPLAGSTDLDLPHRQLTDTRERLGDGLGRRLLAIHLKPRPGHKRGGEGVAVLDRQIVADRSFVGGVLDTER
jgi:hypothetical protein